MMKSGLLLVVTCALALGGCLERKGTSTGPNIGRFEETSIGGDAVSRVDVLFVIDDSGSMAKEHERLAGQIRALVHDLASPPDADGDGTPDWNAAEELRIGITTTDVGMGSTEIPMSGCVLGGEDGALRGGVFTWEAGQDAEAFAASVRDIVDGLGTSGCAFEQPLEAAARTIARAPETGFPRDDGLLALIVVTDEEDCSVDDDDAFFSTMGQYDVNAHCGRNAASLTPVPELLERIRGDRAERDFVYAAIAGVPVDTAPGADLGALLEHPRMQFVEDGGRIPRAEAACGSDAEDSIGRADPARRLVQMAQLVPESVVTTICTEDFGPAISQIVARIGASIPGVCLVRPLRRLDGDGVPCQVTIELPPGDRCADRAGYDFLEIGDDGEEICEVAQVEDGGSGGWYYDADHPDCPQLVLAPDVAPPIGATVAAECFIPQEFPLGALCARNSQCESGFCDPIGDVCAELPATPPGGGTTGD